MLTEGVGRGGINQNRLHPRGVNLSKGGKNGFTTSREIIKSKQKVTFLKKSAGRKKKLIYWKIRPTLPPPPAVGRISADAILRKNYEKGKEEIDIM